MLKFLRPMLAGLACVMSFSASASTYGGTQTYGGLTWSVSTGVTGLTTCTQLYLSATGDFAETSSFTVYGSYNCPAQNGGYGPIGTAIST